MSQDDSGTPRLAEFKPSIRSGSLNIYEWAAEEGQKEWEEPDF